MMIEGFGDVVSEELICEAAELAQTAVLPFLDAVSEFQVKNGKKKRNWDPYYPTKDLYDAVHKLATGVPILTVHVFETLRSKE